MEADVPEVLHVDLEIDENEPHFGILKLLKILRPDWVQDQVQLKTFTEGMTNQLIGCFLRADQSAERGLDRVEDGLLVRVYGRHTELYVDRSEEVHMVRILESRGLGSKIYCSFNNGICYEFLQGAPLTLDQVTQPQIYRLVAAEMARLHSVQFHASELEPFLWRKMDHFLTLIQTSQSVEKVESHSQSEERDESNDQSEENRIDQSEIRSRFWSGPLPDPDLLKTEMILLRSKLSQVKNPVVLCHNDLLSNNIIYHRLHGSVRFIDYEYAAPNFSAFDIGNHFNEFAGVNPVDFSRYPSPGLQLDWIRTYLQNFNQETGREVSEEEVTRLYVHVCKFSLASNLFWGMWAILQSRLSSISFDFTNYAAARLNYYFEKRDQYLSLQEDQGPDLGLDLKAELRPEQSPDKRADQN